MKNLRTVSLLVGLAGLTQGLGAQTAPRAEVSEAKIAKSNYPRRDWEVLFTDGSTMKIALLDDAILLETPYGPLTIPASDIRKMEFGIRYSAEEQQKFESALAALGNRDAKKREEGKAILQSLGEKFAPPLRRAIRKADPETRPHLEQVYDSIAGERSSHKPELRDHDTITTEDSQFSGRVTMTQFRINTFQFGDLKLRVTDAKAIQFGGWKGGIDEKLEIVEAGNFFQLFQTHMGKTVGILITGANQGSIWGSGTYTADSSLAMAAVHAGVLKVGESKVVKIRIVPDIGIYTSSTANGITSNPWQRFPSGAYEIIVK